ncbi:MAG: hypothetical protein B7Y83_14725 [Flavobacteriales bacterium 32-34-25]|nr:MAG: hypothetical protein B7Y83_14725 [Flavobacteriales bacterium 32-34-25]
MENLNLMKVGNKTYLILGLYGGYVYLGNPYDINNEVIKEGVIWEMQPFHEKIPKIINLYYSFIRFFKIDVFGKSEFKNILFSIKLS